MASRGGVTWWRHMTCSRGEVAWLGHAADPEAPDGAIAPAHVQELPQTWKIEEADGIEGMVPREI